MNRNFGKLADGKLTYAPDYIRIDEMGVWNPTAEMYAAAGWLPVVDEKPTGKVGVCHVPTGWEERDGAIRRTYREEPLVPPAPPVIRYSKLKLITAAKKTGKWDALKAWIGEAGVMDEWLVCQYLASDYEGFEEIKAAIVAAGVATADEVEAILAASVDGEVAA